MSSTHHLPPEAAAGTLDEKTAARVEALIEEEEGAQNRFSGWIGYGATMLALAGRMTAYRVASRIPVLRHLADRRLVRRINRQLAGYGRAEVRSDAAHYRPATA